jgi:anti-sigma factor RsiW
VSPHLGDLVSALADGQLAPRETERALAHVARCPLCAAELEHARSARRRLSQAAEVAPAPDLTARLLALSESIPSTQGDPLRAREHDDTWAVPDAWRTTLTGDVAAAASRRRRHRVALVGAAGAGVIGCTLFALGQAPVVSPEASRAAALTTLSGVATTGSTPASVGDLSASGLVAPGALPDGYLLSAVQVDGDVAQIDLTGPDGSVVVREQPGRLAEDATDRLSVGDAREVVVLSRDPWHVAWQDGDVVVEVTTDAPEDVLVEVVAAFPGHDYDAGVLPRLSRGWSTVTGAFTLP